MSQGPFAFDQAGFVGPSPDPDAWEAGRDPVDPGRSGGTAAATGEVDPATVPRTFEHEEGHYKLSLAPLGLTFELDRLRRRSDELVGELTVRCTLPGARTMDGVLGTADFNLSSQRARQDRAKYLEGRSRADLDWLGLLEEFSQKVIVAERAGAPVVMLRDLARPRPDDVHVVDGLPLLRRHPSVIFGDGGAAKSYFALYVAGRMEQAGIRTAVFDWELAGEDHRDRLERLFSADMPATRYARCSRPLVHEIDRLHRIVREERLEFVVLDSVAFACDGPPEAAEVAGRYFQATRQLGTIGSLHVAHVAKAEGADQRPFGSAFWHNGARATWFVKLAESRPGAVEIGLYNRKSNLGGIRAPLGFEITFTEERTLVRRVVVGDSPALAAGMTIKQRMAHVLRAGAMTPAELAEALEVEANTIRTTARRNPQAFTVLDGGRLGLPARRDNERDTPSETGRDNSRDTDGTGR